ncbi:MAG: sigma-70 family RNA polymerase sigma factor [Lachnospiraceae bacterium]|nr:sigma-70 family RNA polymerase sigma factor [Ruminococcus sp.]MCM1273791.1 sigma-70 family RNA polymerase sigma factor [Lachnospiraceae bacterium]
MSSYSECFDGLEKRAKSNGYLTYDDILDAADSFELSAIEVDKLSEQLLLNGVTISDDPPVDEQQFFDYSKIDYESIYREIISIDPGLENLIRQISEFPTPQKGEVSELYAKMEYYNFEGLQADEARERIISMHLRMVLRLALSLSKIYNYDISDAISVGFVGLISAVEKYDPKQNEGGYFSAYAGQVVWSAIIRDCQPNWIHKIPPHLMDKLLTIIKMFKDRYGISAELEIPETDFLLACSKRLGEPIEQIKAYFNMILNETNWMSLNEYAESEDELPINSLLVDYDRFFEDEVNKYQNAEIVHKALKTLPERNVKVLILRYGLDGKIPMTLDEIGKALNVTRERIRQIENKALKLFRQSPDIKYLKDEYMSERLSI